MKSHTEYLVFETRKRREMVHITDEVEEIVRRSGVKDGLCFVSPMHITAAVYVNDLESGLIEDIGKWLEELAPARPFCCVNRPLPRLWEPSPRNPMQRPPPATQLCSTRLRKSFLRWRVRESPVRLRPPSMRN